MTDYSVTIPKIVTPGQLATFLQVPVRTLEHWRQHDDGPPYRKLGRHIRYEISTVMAWFDNE